MVKFSKTTALPSRIFWGGVGDMGRVGIGGNGWQRG